MREVNAILGKELFLGRCGENMASCVVFNISEWQRVYGDGKAQLIHQRNGDKQPYPCVVKQDGKSVTWCVSNADVATAGRGRVELQYYVGDTLVKSETYTTITERALGAATETPPAPYQSWMDKMLDMASETEENAAEAAQSAGEAATSAAAAKASAETAKNCEALTLSYLEDAKTQAGYAEAAADEATAAMRAAEASEAAAAQSEANTAANAEAASSSADRAEAARDSIVLDEEKMAQAVEDAAASASEAAASKEAAATSASNAATSAAGVAASAATASAAAATATSEADRAKAEADRASGAVGGDFATRVEAQAMADKAESDANKYTDQKIATIPAPDMSSKVSKAGDTMTGNLEISKGIPMLSFTVPGGEAYAEIKKNAGTDVDMGININDFASAGNYTQLNLSHADKALRLRVTENGVSTGAYDIYHEGNKPTASDVGAVAKTGDTMTGNLTLNPANNGYSVVKKNATADGDWGLQLQDYGADGSFMGLTVSAKSQKLEFKKKAAGATEYTYPEIYSSDNPQTEVTGDYAQMSFEATDGHSTTLVKNADSANDYGTILRDTNGDAVAELKLSAANKNVKLAHDGKEYVLYHEGNIPTPDVSGQIESHNTSTSAHSDIREAVAAKAPMYTYGTDDLEAGVTALETGKLHFVYE